MSNIFVGQCILSEPELKQLLQDKAVKQPSYYFLRWFHQVSGFLEQLPRDFSCIEGQMFNSDLEIRWKKAGDKYKVLLLSTVGSESGFIPLGDNWEMKQFNAFVYPETETRFPKSIKAEKLNLNQRYFFNSHTATVHFTALTVE
jgi:hypothetical protein